jgi:phosphomannomutase
LSYTPIHILILTFITAYPHTLGATTDSNRFIALMSAITLREHPGSTIVTDSVTSNGLTDFITKLGGKHLRFKRGYKNVISKGVELNKAGEECHLMMETSGHGAVKVRPHSALHVSRTAIS